MSIINKLQYTADAVADIDKALRERSISTRNHPLKDYGNLIRGIRGGDARLNASFIETSHLSSKQELSTGVFISLDYNIISGEYNREFISSFNEVKFAISEYTEREG